MGRLINEDDLIKILKRTSVFECVRNSADKNVFEIIAELPTAYDVEKVVLEINNSENWCNAEMMYPEVAEEIIRKGGV